MHNFILLYNPYYQNDVIESHVAALVSNTSLHGATTAFGKIRSKLRTFNDPLMEKYQGIYKNVSKISPMQLFLTDYANMYVARVIEVTSDDCSNIAPCYYKEKNLDVETWFVIDDIRRIAHNDFELIRDNILSNFSTPHFGNHHYAIYGNQYIYPMQVEMFNPIDYFIYEEKSEYRYFSDIFKSQSYLNIKNNLIHYRFGELFYYMHPNSQDAIVSAEIEFVENMNDSLYDFSAVVIKFAKSVELELYLFLRQIFKYLMDKEPSLEKFSYSVQGRDFTLHDYLSHKPNLGSNKFILKSEPMKNAIQRYFSDASLRYFLGAGISKALFTIQDIRNEAAHGETTSIQECIKIRKNVVGVSENGILSDILMHKRNVVAFIKSV